MNPYKLKYRIKYRTNMEGCVWQKDDKCRIYFNFRPDVASYLELEVDDDNDVIASNPKCYYKGQRKLEPEQAENYIQSIKERMYEIAEKANLEIFFSQDVNKEATVFRKKANI